MSDCHSWLGTARSKRRGPCSRARASGVAWMSPSSCRNRRTACSEIPIAAKRFSTSRIRRVPQSWCSRLSSTTCSRTGDVFSGRSPRLPACLRLDSSAAGPSLRNAVVHFCTAAPETPNAAATSSCGVPFIRACTTSSLYSVGISRPPPPRCFFFVIASPVLPTRVGGSRETSARSFARRQASRHWRAAQCAAPDYLTGL